MALTVEDVGVYNDTGNSTSHDANLPAPTGGILANDWLVACYGVDSGGQSETVSWPGGWTELLDDAQGTTAGGRLAIAYLLASGGESGTITITTSANQGGGCRILCIRGGDPNTPPELTSTKNASTNPDPPSHTASWGAADNMFIAVHGADGNLATTAGPSGYSGFGDTRWTNNAGADCATAYKVVTNAATEDPGAFTRSSEDWVAATVAIRPASAQAYEDSGTVTLALTPSATAEEHTTFDSGTELLALTVSGTEEKQQYDAATVLLKFTPSGRDLPLLTPPLSATFEEGSDGNSIPLTAGSPSFSSKDGSAVYDAETGPYGSMSAAFTTGGGLTWQNVKSLDVARFSCVLKHSFTFDDVHDPIEFQNLFYNIGGGSSWEVLISLQALTDTTFTFRAIGSPALFSSTGTTVIADGSYFRVDVVVNKLTTSVRVELYTNPSSETPTETLGPFSNALFGNAADYVAFGRTGDATASGTFYFEEVLYEQKAFKDEATVLLAFTPSATEERQQYDADTEAFALTPSGTDTAQYVDSNTAALALSPSATEERQQYDADTTRVSLIASGTDVAEFIDTDTELFKLTPSGSDEYTPGAGGTEYLDSGTELFTLLASGSDIAVLVDAATEVLTLTPSATEERQQYDADTISLSLLPSAIDTAQFVDSDQLRLAFSPSATEERQQYDTGTILFALSPSAADIAAYVDSETVPLGFLPSGLDVVEYIESATELFILTPEGTEGFGGNIDEATVVLTLTPSVQLEIHYLFDTLLVGTLVQHFTGALSNRWSTDILTSKWFGMMLNRKYSGAIVTERGWTGALAAGRRWTGTFLQRFTAIYRGRGEP